MCHKDGKAFKRRLVHSVALIIMAYNNFVPLFKSFIANVLKCKACLKGNFKCLCVTMFSLVMTLFSHDYIKTEIDQLKYQLSFSLITCIQYSHSAWILDGRTSILVLC